MSLKLEGTEPGLGFGAVTLHPDRGHLILWKVTQPRFPPSGSQLWVLHTGYCPSWNLENPIALFVDVLISNTYCSRFTLL